MAKQLIASRLREYFIEHGPQSLFQASEDLGESVSSIQKCAYKMRDKGLAEETGEKVRFNKLPCKVWRITEKGKSADPVNPLLSKAATYGRTAQWRQRQADQAERRTAANWAAADLRASNKVKEDADFSKVDGVKTADYLRDRWQAESTMVPCFSTLKPGQYAFDPASCAARAA